MIDAWSSASTTIVFAPSDNVTVPAATPPPAGNEAVTPAGVDVTAVEVASVTVASTATLASPGPKHAPFCGAVIDTTGADKSNVTVRVT